MRPEQVMFLLGRRRSAGKELQEVLLFPKWAEVVTRNEDQIFPKRDQYFFRSEGKPAGKCCTD